MKHLIVAATLMAVVLFSGIWGCGSGDKSAGDTKLKAEVNDLQKSAGQAAKAKTSARKKYDIKSGIIHFTVEDFGGSHKEVVYFDDYGLKERIEILEEDGNIRETRFTDGQKMYIVNEYTPENTIYIMSDNATNGTEMRFDKEGFHESQKEKYAYQDKPDMKVAGKSCGAYSMKTNFGDVIYAGWSHITLYHHQETSHGKILKQAVSLEENAAVPAEKFTVPAGYEVKTM
ncbi:MAG: hypothetical protein WAN36_15395 [Calditrichia bacterium]